MIRQHRSDVRSVVPGPEAERRTLCLLEGQQDPMSATFRLAVPGLYRIHFAGLICILHLVDLSGVSVGLTHLLRVCNLIRALWIFCF